MADEDVAKKERSIHPKQILAGALLVLAVVFCFENTRKTTIRFIIPEVETPLYVALLMTLVVGILIGILLQRRRSR